MGTTGLTLNANGSFAYTPPANFSGAASFTYKANDGVFDSNTVTVDLTVNPANEVPSFTKGANQSTELGSGVQTVAGWATAISQGTGESGQLVDFVVTNDSDSLFTVQPSVSANGTLSYTPGNTTGVATVSVRIHDNGGTANGGVDTSAIQTFTISITADVYGPSGGSVDAAGLVGTGSRYAPSTALSIVFAPGTDPSGVATTGAELKRSTATLTSAGGTADGGCGTFGGYTLVTGGNDPTLTAGRHRHRSGLLPLPLHRPRHPGQRHDLHEPGHQGRPNGAGAAVARRRRVHQHLLERRRFDRGLPPAAAATGAFTATATATDTGSGIASYTYPALGTNWTSTPGAWA